MKAIRPGARGPAVEDIQRRLLHLGYDLGPTGVDGVFLGRTAEAVRAFQIEASIAEDSVVGEETWSALVDATFTIGDRMLYLRLPHFHGQDVRTLQQALNALGFACGAADGIFGAYTERALREFQRNAALPPDGIAGDETFAAMLAVRHVWQGKDSRSHSAARATGARAADVLARASFAATGCDEIGASVAERLVNLAHATTDGARATFVAAGAEIPAGTRFTLALCADGTASATEGRPIVRLDPVATLTSRLLTALESSREPHPYVVIEVGDKPEGDERELQRAAVRLLDSVCSVFA